jgi:hypothetical protein
MVTRKDGWLAAKVGNELVMMSAESGVYIGLNDVGAFIWDLIETPHDLDQIYTILSSEFETTLDGCRPEVDRFLAELETRGAISLAP